jgi:F0F1-type ATP synthase membrane subunit a
LGLLARRLALVPGRRQALLEAVVDFLREVVYGTLGPKDGRRFLPLIGTIFLFVWTSNVIGLIPTGDLFRTVNAWRGHPEYGTNLIVEFSSGTLSIPGAIEPSRNVNFPWGLGIMVFFLMHGLAIRRKGMARYLDEYFEPHLGGFTWPYQKWWARIVMALVGLGLAGGLGYAVGHFFESQWRERWPAAEPWISLGLAGALGLYAFVCYLVKPVFGPKRIGVPNIFMAPLNIIGKFAEILSMCFRLFGNIFGGAIIMLMIASAIKPVLPIFLHGFFGLFVGTVQAFVFAVLCLTYIAVEIREEEEVPSLAPSEGPGAEGAAA